MHISLRVPGTLKKVSLFLFQVQLRLQQVVGAAPEKREDLLRELEQFAFRGIPNLASPRIPKQTEVEDEAPPSIEPEVDEISKEHVSD